MHQIILKLHLIVVVFSVLIYLARVGFTLTGSKLADNKAILLAAVGSMLLIVISAGALTVSLGQYPFTDGWLTEKLIGLIAYIVLGVVSLKPGMAKLARLPFIALAMGGFVFAMLVAKQHAGFFL